MKGFPMKKKKSIFGNSNGWTTLKSLIVFAALLFLFSPLTYPSQRSSEIGQMEAKRTATTQISAASETKDASFEKNNNQAGVQNLTEFLMNSDSPISQDPAKTSLKIQETKNAKTLSDEISTLTKSASDTLAVAPATSTTIAQTHPDEEVAMLVSEQCSQSGEEAVTTTSCVRVYSNGNRATVATLLSYEGDEAKKQTLIEEFNSEDQLIYRKTIRHRLDYNYAGDKKTKEKEFFDIIYQPTGKKATRELMVYQFYLDTGKIMSLSWTQYRQIGDEPKAGLNFYATLRFGEDGSPELGIAERWDAGEKVTSFIDWNRISDGYAALDEEAWHEWENWILNVSLQAYLP